MNPYVVINKSNSKHCCFGYSIVDNRTKVWNDYINNWMYEAAICETFQEKHAHLICRLLNEDENAKSC